MLNSSIFEIGFSPCPNDTFIFDALVHQRLESDLYFKYLLKDVEELNRMAKTATLDISKMSFAAYAFVSNEYQILSSGSALGKNCGPLIISKKPLTLGDLKNCKVAIPGKYTTANLLMSIFVPQCHEKKEMLFSEIEDAVLNGDCDAGLIIHENRFTYQQKGLLKVADMGELWEQKTGKPIPLGCIAVRRSLPEAKKLEIDALIRQSVEFAFKNPSSSRDFVQQNAREMDPSVQQQHIDLYVNKFSIDLGEEGEKAVRELFEEGVQCGLLPELIEPVFI
ncbi:1,4-dihydroxy-6-naphthoate synthase [soil metagenome]